MSEKRSGQDRRSGVDHMLFFDRRTGKDRRSNRNPAKRTLIFKRRDTEKKMEKVVLGNRGLKSHFD